MQMDRVPVGGDVRKPKEKGLWWNWTLAVVSALMFASAAAWCPDGKRLVVPYLEEDGGLEGGLSAFAGSGGVVRGSCW